MDLAQTVPDTITKWVAGAFCVSPVGFGVAPGVELTAFQPFFVSLTLPTSVIRGEVFTLRATVFNYLPECIRVRSRSLFFSAPLSLADAVVSRPLSLSTGRSRSRWRNPSSTPSGAATAAATRCVCAARRARPSPGS